MYIVTRIKIRLVLPRCIIVKFTHFFSKTYICLGLSNVYLFMIHKAVHTEKAKKKQLFLCSDLLGVTTEWSKKCVLYFFYVVTSVWVYIAISNCMLCLVTVNMAICTYCKKINGSTKLGTHSIFTLNPCAAKTAFLFVV